MHHKPPIYTLFPYTTLFRSVGDEETVPLDHEDMPLTFSIDEEEKILQTFIDHLRKDNVSVFGKLFGKPLGTLPPDTDRKSTRLNSSHVAISYAVFCLKKKIH